MLCLAFSELAKICVAAKELCVFLRSSYVADYAFLFSIIWLQYGIRSNNMENKFIIENGVLKSANITDSTIIIPKDVTRIGAGAFKNGTFEAVSFAGNSIKSIDEDAFRECKRLQSIMMPDGIIQIGDHAFYGCSNLKYIGIPSSVIVIGDDVLGNCNSDLFIIGEEESEAAKIAKQYNFILKPNDNNTISAYNAAINAKKTNKTKTFEVFGEKVVCSNTLSTYYRTIEHYSNRKDDVFRLLSSRIPMTINEQFGDLLEVLQNEQDNTIQRLSYQGVFVRPSILEPYILESYRSIYAALEAIKEAYDSIKSSVESGISNNNAALIREAESKVTGLSYGFLGGGFDMVAYSLDDYREKKRQRKAAYAEAERKSKEFSQQQILNGKLQYSSFIAQALPYLNQGTDMFVDALCKAEIDQLIHSGLIDSESARDVDIQKSNQLLNSISDDNADNSFTIALAIKKYPCNIAAFVYAKEHQYSCTGLIELMSFLHLTKKVDDIVCNNKNNRIEKLTEKVQSANSGNSGVEEIEKNLDWLSKEDIKRLLTFLAKTISPMIDKIFYPESYENTSNVRLYCTKKYSNVIDNKSWDFFIKYNVNPIPSVSTSNEMIDYDVAIDLLCNKFEQIRKEEQEKKNELDYQKALIDYKSNNLESIKNAKKMFEKLSGYKDSDLLVSECDKKIHKKKQRIVITAVGVIGVVLTVIIIFVVLQNAFFIPNQKYNLALDLIASGEYDDAKVILNELGTYKNADNFDLVVNRANYQKASEFYNNAEYKEAIPFFEKSGEYEETVERLKKCYYEVGLECYKNDDMDFAIQYMDKAQPYKDSTDKYTAYNNELIQIGKERREKNTRTFIIDELSNGIVAVRSNGTIVSSVSQIDLSSWKDIVSIAGDGKKFIGLKSDGTVVSNFESDIISSWINIVDVECNNSGSETIFCGVTAGGRVVTTGPDYYSDWKDITNLIVSDGGAVTGITREGKIVGVLDDLNASGVKYAQYSEKGYVVLDEYGSVDSTWPNQQFGFYATPKDKPKLSSWKNIKSISIENDIAVAIDYNNNVVYDYRGLNGFNATNAVEIHIGGDYYYNTIYAVVLTDDGKLLSSEKCPINVASFTNLRVPNQKD